MSTSNPYMTVHIVFCSFSENCGRLPPTPNWTIGWMDQKSTNPPMLTGKDRRDDIEENRRRMKTSRSNPPPRSKLNASLQCSLFFQVPVVCAAGYLTTAPSYWEPPSVGGSQALG